MQIVNFIALILNYEPEAGRYINSDPIDEKEYQAQQLFGHYRVIFGNI
ncbi:hypothetical protein [Nitrosomonas sp. PY1]|nr:hypothetical protein [Nitrosomonas sp. PY1]